MIENKNLLHRSNDKLAQLCRQAGYVLMAAAAITGIMELPNHQGNQVVNLINQPSVAFASHSPSVENPLRREKESTETGTVQISYNTVQRTPARSIGIK